MTVFRDIELICRIDGIAHIGKGRVALILQHQLQVIFSGIQNLLYRLRIPNAGQNVAHNILYLVQRDAAIGQL